MKIKSNYRDYYDSALSYGVDTDLIYVRNPTPMSKEQLTTLAPIFKLFDKMPSSMDISRHTNGLLQKIYLIGVCGKLYPAFMWRDEIHYTTKKLMSGFPSDTPKSTLKVIDELLNQDKPYKMFFNNGSFTHKSWQLAINEFKDKRFDDVFVSLGVPLFLIHHNYRGREQFGELNPNLKNLNFQIIKNPVDMFQEISLFIGNQLAIQQDPVPINVPDKFLIQKKGFDEWSFRKKGSKS